MEAPVHVVSSVNEAVTQWMSTVGVSAGSARSSSHVHETGSSIARDPERPRVERRVRRREDRQDGELVDDVLARWDAGAVDERAVASEAT